MIQSLWLSHFFTGAVVLAAEEADEPLVDAEAAAEDEAAAVLLPPLADAIPATCVECA